MRKGSPSQVLREGSLADKVVRISIGAVFGIPFAVIGCVVLIAAAREGDGANIASGVAMIAIGWFFIHYMLKAIRG